MYELNDFALITEGIVAPTAGGDYCLASFPLATHGVVVLLVDALGKLADPRTREPWDPDYYRWKYSRQRQDSVRTPEAPEPERPDFMPELLARDLEATQLERLRRKNAQTERDILELQAYISEVEIGLESGIAAELAAQEAEILAQDELMARLAENVRLARETLLVVLEARRRHQNQIAAIEAVIRVYY